MWYKYAKQQELDFNLPSVPKELDEEEQMYDWLENADSVAMDAMDSFLQNPNNPQQWEVVPFARLKKIWQDYATYGVIRDEKGLDEIVNLMIKNTLLLHFNTTMMGHTQTSVRDYAEQYLPEGSKWTGRLEDALDNHMEDEDGAWRISDYALEPLMNLASQLKYETKPETKLYLIDRMLNTIHQRSDIAALFVEGGSGSLSELSN
jgi:hypothetical protein